MQLPRLREMVFRRDQLRALLLWPICELRGHPERHEIALADTLSVSEAELIIAGLRPIPEATGRTIRYFTCRCWAHERSEPV
jgi:hypothetical protein